MKKLLAACAALTLGTVGLQAQVLLDIQITSPDTMVITSTGLGPVTSDDSHTYFDGIDLLGLFSPEKGPKQLGPTIAPDVSVVSSTLTTGDGSTGPIYDDADFDSFSEPHADLNLFQLGFAVSSPSETFSFKQSAFADGTSVTVTFSGVKFSGIDYGVIMAGNSGSGSVINTDIVTADVATNNNAVPIGVYHVTVAPEPSTYALMLGGFVLLGFCVRRKLA